MAYYDNVANSVVLEAVVTGTHSSGKSTLVESFRDTDLTLEYGIPEPFGFDLLDLGDPDNSPVLDKRIPLITIGEAATDYAQQQGNPALIGDEYSLATQQKIERLGMFNLAKAQVVLAGAINRARSEFGHDSIANVALTLSDRWPTDGKPYSQLRLPEADSDMIGTYPFRQEQLRNAVSSLDFVFLTKPQEVPFERTTARPSDAQLRDNIHDELLELYKDISQNPIFELQGTKSERHDSLKAHLTMLLGSHFVARTMVAAYMNGDYARAESHLSPTLRKT